MRSTLCAASFIAAITWWASPAYAQDASRAAAAETLFVEGKRLMATGNYPRACASFAKSQELDPGAGTALNLADCYEKNGQTASAWATYKEAASLAAASGRKDWATRARGRAQALEPHLSRLTIIVPPGNARDSLAVTRDAAAVTAPEWGLPIPVDPGDHTIEVTAPQRVKWTQVAHVGGSSDLVEVTVPSLVPLAVETPPQAPQAAAEKAKPAPSDLGDAQRVVGITIGAAGLAAGIVGGIFGFEAKSHRDDARGNCSPDLSVCGAAGTESMKQARSSATASTAFMVVGGGLVAGGVVVWLIAPRGGSSSTAQAVIGPGSFGLVGKF